VEFFLKNQVDITMFLVAGRRIRLDTSWTKS